MQTNKLNSLIKRLNYKKLSKKKKRKYLQQLSILEQKESNKERKLKMENKNLWDIEDIIKQLALDGYDKIGLFETSNHLEIHQDEVLECFIHLSERDYPKLNIKVLITCPIHREVLYSYNLNKGLNQIQSQYYCHYCESIIDVDAEYVYLQFLINKNYLKFAKECRRKRKLEKAKELAKYINRKTEEAGLTYEEIQEDVYRAWLEIRKEKEENK